MKKTFAGILLVTLFAPMLYLGVLPPKEAEAQAGLGSCLLGQLVSSAIRGGLYLVQGAIAALGIDLTLEAPAALTGETEDPSGSAQTGAGWANAAAVPTSETNPLMLKSLGTGNRASAGSALANLASTGIDAVTSFIAGLGTDSTMSLLFKECVLDPLAWLLKNVIIERIAHDIMVWVRNGFEGAPAFMTDPVSFMQDIGDAAVGLLLFESGLDQYLCSPFQLNVVVDTYLNYNMPSFNSQGNMACTLDDVFQNFSHPELSLDANAGFQQVAGMGNLDFEGGGLKAVFGMLEDKNNPYGTYFNLQSEASARTQSFRQKENTLVINGNGWLSPRCDLDGDTVNDNVCTPGTWVAQQVDAWSNNSLSQLTAADELGEIIDAILAGLVTRVLREVGMGGEGLLQGGSPGNWSTSQYQMTAAEYRQMYNQTRDAQQNSVTQGPNPFAGAGGLGGGNNQ
jgi:hypothetical protein